MNWRVGGFDNDWLWEAAEIVRANQEIQASGDGPRAIDERSGPTRADAAPTGAAAPVASPVDPDVVVLADRRHDV